MRKRPPHRSIPIPTPTPTTTTTTTRVNKESSGPLLTSQTLYVTTVTAGDTRGNAVPPPAGHHLLASPEDKGGIRR